MKIEDLHIESARLAAARSLSPDELEQAWVAGRTMTLEQAVAAADELRRDAKESSTGRGRAE
jgi:hypothetical protein